MISFNVNKFSDYRIGTSLNNANKIDICEKSLEQNKNNNLYVKHDNGYVNYGSISEFSLSYSKTENNINNIILTKFLNLVDLNEPIQVNGCIAIFGYYNGKNDYIPITLFELGHLHNLYNIIICYEGVYYKSNSNLYINNKLITYYNPKEFIDIEKSKSFTIGPVLQKKSILEYYSCKIENNRLTMLPIDSSNYPCHSGIFETLINHYEVNTIVINRIYGVELYKELLKYNIPIITM